MQVERTGSGIERKIHSGLWPVLLYALVFLVGFYMQNHPRIYPPYSWQGLFTLAFLYEGTYCIRNLLHCRESHCIVTGSGWTIIGFLSLLSTAGIISYSDWGIYWLAFVLVYIAGMSFQHFYYLWKHSIQLR
jgi:hypothetical protein